MRPLVFPPGFPTSAAKSQYDEPTINIRQFSVGCLHILGVSDSGRIWSWNDADKPALHIKFLDMELKEIYPMGKAGRRSDNGIVKQVIAARKCSSAYIHGIGIVLWDPVARDHEEDDADTMLVMKTSTVPNTDYQRPKKGQIESDEQRLIGDSIGAVLNYILLEQFVVFVTDTGRVFCSRILMKSTVERILELHSLRGSPEAVLDVQGSCRHFAILRDKEVITGEMNDLYEHWVLWRNGSEETHIPGLLKVPALQDTGVVQVAFGFGHFLALHSNGKITSYGKEGKPCGAMGLGAPRTMESQIRGIRYTGPWHSGLLQHAYTSGREVWFSHEKHDWVSSMTADPNAPDFDEVRSRIELFRTNEEVQAEVSEWVEQESRAWDNEHIGEDGLSAYFAVGITAAGWHSGALMLVNDELAAQASTTPLKERSFPRLRLSDGSEMPGTKALDKWRTGVTDWKLDLRYRENPSQ